MSMLGRLVRDCVVVGVVGFVGRLSSEVVGARECVLCCGVVVMLLGRLLVDDEAGLLRPMIVMFDWFLL